MFLILAVATALFFRISRRVVKVALVIVLAPVLYGPRSKDVAIEDPVLVNEGARPKP